MKYEAAIIACSVLLAGCTSAPKSATAAIASPPATFYPQRGLLSLPPMPPVPEPPVRSPSYSANIIRPTVLQSGELSIHIGLGSVVIHIAPGAKGTLFSSRNLTDWTEETLIRTEDGLSSFVTAVAEARCFYKLQR
jgi:hypothetical protein